MQDTNIEKFAEVASTMSVLCEGYSYYYLMTTYVKEKYPELYTEASTYAQENLFVDHNPISDLLQQDVG
tara:strand:+ start:168 stop:374 length:207 start_codon:yes stop_codon:yes gene_type:complete